MILLLTYTHTRKPTHTKKIVTLIVVMIRRINDFTIINLASHTFMPDVFINVIPHCLCPHATWLGSHFARRYISHIFYSCVSRSCCHAVVAGAHLGMCAASFNIFLLDCPSRPLMLFQNFAFPLDSRKCMKTVY